MRVSSAEGPRRRHLRVVRANLRPAYGARISAKAPWTTRTSSPVETAARSSAQRQPERAFVLVQHKLLERGLPPRDRPRSPRSARPRGGFVERVHATQEAAELEAAEDLLQRGAVGRRGDELGRVDVERQVAPHRREELRVACLVGVLTDRAATGRRELVGVRDHLLERPVLRDQLARGLVPDPGDPRDVVRGVPLQPDEVRHLVGAHAVAQLDALGRVDVNVGDPARGHHQRDVLAAELERVAVGRDDAGAGFLSRPRASRASRSRRPPPSPRTRGCDSRTPRRSAGSAGTAPAAGPASGAGPPCRSRRSPSGASVACPKRPRRRAAGSRREA